MENFVILLIMYMLSLFLLVLYYKHMLMFLISLEFLMIVIYYNMFMLMLLMEFKVIFMIYYLIVVVCEACLGLTLIILLVRLYGNDFMKSVMLKES